jgi:hypothetical protein
MKRKWLKFTRCFSLIVQNLCQPFCDKFISWFLTIILDATVHESRTALDLVNTTCVLVSCTCLQKSTMCLLSTPPWELASLFWIHEKWSLFSNLQPPVRYWFSGSTLLECFVLITLAEMSYFHVTHQQTSSQAAGFDTCYVFSWQCQARVVLSQEFVGKKGQNPPVPNAFPPSPCLGFQYIAIHTHCTSDSEPSHRFETT